MAYRPQVVVGLHLRQSDLEAAQDCLEEAGKC